MGLGPRERMALKVITGLAIGGAITAIALYTYVLYLMV